MSSPSRPDRVPTRDDITQAGPSLSNNRNNSSYSDTAYDLLKQAPRRQTETEDFYRITSATVTYSLTEEEVQREKRKLEKALDEKQKLPRVAYTRHWADVSDSHPVGPWSRKVILCLDGGGVKGYFSLLVLKRLISIIEEFELGKRPYTLPDQAPEYYPPHEVGEHCPWADPEPTIKEPAERSDGSEETDLGALKKRVTEVLQSSQSNNYKIHQYVDYIAGTSTGGLSAIMLARLEMSVQEALNQYDVVGNDVFGKPRFLHSTFGVADFVLEKYSARQMEDALIKVVGNGLLDPQVRLRKAKKWDSWKAKYIRDAKFSSDPNRCRTIVIAHGPSENKDVTGTYLFRSYDHPHPSPWFSATQKEKHNNPGTATAAPIWMVGRATSAAPKYFPPMVIDDREFRDGALGTNNPALVAMNEVYQMHRHSPKILLSIGTGLSAKKTPIGKAPKLTVARGWRNVAKASKYIITQSEGTAATVSQLCEDAKTPIDYFRWNAPKIGDVKLDEWKPSTGGTTTKQIITNLTIEYLSTPAAHRALVKYARDLVNLRRRRANTERWETFAKQVIYYCPEPMCHRKKISETFATRDELRDHALYVHSYISQVNVANIDELEQTCVYDHCGVKDVYVFRDLEDFADHLNDVHSVTNPVFMPPNRMEAWLDIGRMTQTDAVKDAIKRHDSQLQDAADKASGKARAPNSPNGTIPTTNGAGRPGEDAVSGAER